MTTLLSITTPPSVNNLFTNVPGRGRVKSRRYRQWLKAAGWELQGQRPLKIAGPFEVEIQVPPTRGDLDNYTKAVIDLLVRHGVVEGDGPKLNMGMRLVRRPDIKKTLVIIREFARSATRETGGGVAGAGGGPAVVGTNPDTSSPRAHGVPA